MSVTAEHKKADKIKPKLAEVKKIASEAKISKPKATPKVTGDKHTWLAASGIPQSEWQYVDYIVQKESSWNPSAVNPNGGACGLAQSLPCGKQSAYGHWSDPVANLKWQYEYVTERYGGYAQAYAFWLNNKWY